MVEINIKRNTGEIINVRPDGFYDNHPWLTVLKVQDISPEEIEKLRDHVYDFVDVDAQIKVSKWNNIKSKQKDETINDKIQTGVYDMEYKDITEGEVTKIGKEDYIHITGKRLKTIENRRFKLSLAEVQRLFPNNETRKEITKNQFLTLLDDVEDKSHTKTKLKEATWFSTFKDDLSQGRLKKNGN